MKIKLGPRQWCGTPQDRAAVLDMLVPSDTEKLRGREPVQGTPRDTHPPPKSGCCGLLYQRLH